MSRRLSPREQEQRRQRRQAVAMGSFGVVVLLALLCLVGYNHLHSVSRNPTTNCPTDSSNLHGYTAVVIDATDTMNQAQIGKLREIIEYEASELPADARLVVLSLTDRGELIKLKFDRCSTDAGGEGMGLIDNPQLQKKQWEQTYWGPLQALLGELPNLPEASRTPLMEGLQKLSTSGDISPPRHLRESGWDLIVVSDLLQHTDALSSYREPNITLEEFRRRGEFHSTRADLEGARVSVYLVHRPTPFEKGMQGMQQAQFWNLWFDACQAVNFRIKRLVG